MSSFRGGRGSSRARGAPNSGAPPTGPASSTTSAAPAHSNNGGNNGSNNRTQRAGFAAFNGRGRGGQHVRGNGIARGGPGGPRPQRERGGGQGPGQSKGRGAIANISAPQVGRISSMNGGHGDSYPDRFQALKKKREQGRADAIAQGFLADPDKPRTLAEAITPVGTCPDMCAEFERLERIVQKDVWAAETEPGSEGNTPAEHRMVKKFRRAAAGLDEQLPSDLRPPPVLKKTVDYLFDQVIASATSLAAVHHFVWDRTRAIRNDFSIQQVTKIPDLKIAIDCYERIARFHILSLHQLALPEKPYDKYDWYQEREQLDRTLLSLMQYYDDVKGRLTCANEPEFRAYLVIFQAQDPNPDQEERINTWEPRVKSHPRVRKALELYSAACNVLDPQGTLKPLAVHPVAREDWDRFFVLVRSNAISYLMACVSEIYFNLMRRTALNAIWCAFRTQSAKHDVTDFHVELMTDLLGFDDDDQTEHFCQQYGFVFNNPHTGHGPRFLNLKSVAGTKFPAATQGMPHQTFSGRLVESKRAGRTFPAIINGLSVLAAQDQGLIEEVSQYDYQTEEDEDSLFVPEDHVPQKRNTSPSFLGSDNEQKAWSSVAPKVPDTDSAPFPRAASPFTATPFTGNVANGVPSAFTNTSNFGQPSTVISNPSGANSLASSPFAFGQPSVTASSPFAAAESTIKTSIFAQQPTHINQLPGSEKQPGSPFNFVKPSGMSTATPNATAQTGSAFGAGAEKRNTMNQSDAAFAPSPFATTKPPSLTEASKQSKPPPSFSWTTPPDSLANTNQKDFSSSPFSQPQAMPAVSTANTTSILQSAVKSQPSSVNDTITKTTFGFPSSSSTSTSVTNTEKADSTKGHFEVLPPQASEATKEASTLTPGSQPFVSAFQGHPVNQTLEPSILETVPPPAPVASPTPPFTFATQPNQPKKPSPLFQSFSAAENGAKVKSPSRGQASVQAAKSSTGVQHEINHSPPVSIIPPTPTLNNTADSHGFTAAPPSKEETLQRLAQEVTLDVNTGFIRQYVEFHARQAILDVYDQLYMESLQELADKFRTETLALRYGRKWRDTCWRRRLARQGRERRKRVKKSQSTKELGRKLAAETNAVDDFLKSVQGNRTNGIHEANNGGHTNHLDQNSRTMQQTASGRSKYSGGTPAGGKEHPSDRTPRKNDSKRVDHLDSAGRVSKPPLIPSYHVTPGKPSHLSMSTLGSRSSGTAQKSTSRSNYFRLKAMGINPNGESVATPTGRKRVREDSEEAVSDISSIARKSRTPPHTTMNGHEDHAEYEIQSLPDLRPQNVTAADTSRSRAENEDEALFARARAARQALSDSAAWYRSEVHKDQNQRDQEMARSLATPSMQRARETARLRASQNILSLDGSILDLGLTPRVPAYRFRESRFVPREQYGKAIARSKQMLEARSRSPLQAGSGLSTSYSGISQAPRHSALDSAQEIAASSAYPLQEYQQHSVIPDSFSSQDQMGPHDPVPDDLHFSQATEYTEDNHSVIAEAIHNAMMQSNQVDQVYPNPSDYVVPDSFGNPVEVNGVNNEQLPLEPSLRDWVNDDENGATEHMTEEGEGDYYDTEDEAEYAQNPEYDVEEGIYDEDGEEYDEDGEEFDEEEDEDEDEDEEDEEQDDLGEGNTAYNTQYRPTQASQPQFRPTFATLGTKGQLGPSAIVKGSGTQEDAFELSD